MTCFVATQEKRCTGVLGCSASFSIPISRPGESGVGLMPQKRLAIHVFLQPRIIRKIPYVPSFCSGKNFPTCFEKWWSPIFEQNIPSMKFG